MNDYLVVIIRTKIYVTRVFKTKVTLSAFREKKQTNKCMKWNVDDVLRSLHILREEAALWSAGTTADTPVSFAGWQRGEQTVAGLAAVFQCPLRRHLTSRMSLMPRRWIPVMFWMVLITLCGAVLSWAVHKPCQFGMFPVRMLSITPQ